MMVTRNSVGSGGLIERAIFVIAGCFMAVIGLLLAWLAYQWATSGTPMQGRWIWMTAAGGLSFFTLRGAWYTLMPKRSTRKFELETTR